MVMESIYYEASSPGSFGGVRALARYSGMPVKTATKWLETQDSYTLHKPIVKKFQRRKTFAKGINDLFQADLADMRNLASYNAGYSYILTCIDVFSRYAFAVPIKDKRGVTVADAFEKIFVERVPNMLQTDRGLEFLNAQVQQVFRKHNIHHYFSLNDDIKAALVERLNRTLKSRLYRYMTGRHTNRWVDVLDAVVRSYNQSLHRSIGMAPIDVTSDREDEIARRLYPPKPPLRYKYEIGDRVRITKYKHVLHKGYLPNWTEEIFEIADKFPTHPVTYGLKDLAGEDIKGKFYEQEIQKVVKTDNVYDVEKILKTRRRCGKVEYLVKWKGYPEKFNSWINERPFLHNPAV
jgi:transposase InsO family protein